MGTFAPQVMPDSWTISQCSPDGRNAYKEESAGFCLLFYTLPCISRVLWGWTCHLRQFAMYIRFLVASRTLVGLFVVEWLRLSHCEWCFYRDERLLGNLRWPMQSLRTDFLFLDYVHSLLFLMLDSKLISYEPKVIIWDKGMPKVDKSSCNSIS